MFANIIYKETISPYTKQISKIELIELEENEANASRYTKLYALQLPLDEKTKSFYKHIKVIVS